MFIMRETCPLTLLSENSKPAMASRTFGARVRAIFSVSLTCPYGCSIIAKIIVDWYPCQQLIIYESTDRISK